MRQKKRKTEKETQHRCHHDSFHCSRGHSGKTKQVTNWSVSSFKGKLKFFQFEIVEYETPAFKRKIEIKPIPILFISLTTKNLLLILLSVIRIGFYAQFHWLCYKTVGSCF